MQLCGKKRVIQTQDGHTLPGTKKSIMFITATDRTTATPERIWKIWTDVTNWKNWDPFLKDAKITGVFKENSKGSMWPSRGLRTAFKVTKCVPNFAYTVSFRLFLAEIHIHRFLGYNNQKTTFTHQFWVEGPLGELWWFFFGRKLQKIMISEMEKVKFIAESKN